MEESVILAMASEIEWQKILDSSFVTAVVGSLAGAYFGAKGAQVLAVNAKLKDDVTQEIRNTNAAIATCSAFFSAGVSLMEDYVSSIKSNFAEQKSAVIEELRQRAIGTRQGDAAFKLEANYLDLQPLSFPTDLLRTLVFERTSVIGRPLHLVNALETSANLLNGALTARHNLIQTLGEIKEDDVRLYKYLGLKQKNGEHDTRFADNIDAIHQYLKSVIYFSNLLSKDMHLHGIARREDMPKSFFRKKVLIKVTKVIVKGSESMIPPDSEYKSWHDAFQQTSVP